MSSGIVPNQVAKSNGLLLGRFGIQCSDLPFSPERLGLEDHSDAYLVA